jgi:hypothetical protein
LYRTWISWGGDIENEELDPKDEGAGSKKRSWISCGSIRSKQSRPFEK